MKQAALTFDDGPNAGYTSKILDILKKHKIKACFFLLGENVEYYPAIAGRIKQEGHLIGNHTYNHSHPKTLNKKEILWQIEEAEKAYKKILNLRPAFFRPPYGEYNKKTIAILKSKGYKMVLWNACADDWKCPPPEMIAEKIISQAKDGSIILLHDGANIRHNESRMNTVKALPKIIKGLKEKGFIFVRLDRLMKNRSSAL